MNSKVILSAILVVVLVGFGYLVYQNYLAPPAQPIPTPQAVPAEPGLLPPDMVSAEGEVRPARTVELAFVQAGQVAEVLVEDGQTVQTGQTLARLDASRLQANLEQAEAALQVAQANLQAAGTRLEQARTAAQAAEAQARAGAWSTPEPPSFGLPNWYFNPSQELASAEAELEAAQANREAEQANLETVLARQASEDLLAAEARIADAQAAFRVADDVLERARRPNDRELLDAAQRRFDIVQSELNAAQDSYDQILDTEAAEDVLEARARLAVARERFEIARDRLNSLRTGDESLEVRAAEDAQAQAAAAVSEAEAARSAARLALADTQLEAPFEGVLVAVDVSEGQAASPGLVVMVLADLSTWVVETTDLSESDVALVEVGMPAEISLDAFPEQILVGQVSRIGLVGEASRGAVVYSVRLAFQPGDLPVRWGMTAFVDIRLFD